MYKILGFFIIVFITILFTSCEKDETKDTIYNIAENDIKTHLNENKFEFISVKAESKRDIYLSDIYYNIAVSSINKEIRRQFLDSAMIYVNKPNNYLGISVKCLIKYHISKHLIGKHYYIFYYNNKKFIYQFDCDLDNFIKDNFIFKF